LVLTIKERICINACRKESFDAKIIKLQTRKSNVTLDITKFPTWGKQAVTGRIKDWMKNSGSRLPVSCTVFVCDDNNIDESFIFTSKALRNAAGVAIHLPENIKPINRSFEWRVYLGENCEDEYGTVLPEIFMEPETHEYVISVADSMEESESLAMSIENSWLAFLNYTGTRPLVVDLSRLRTKGTTNSQGLTASGASSFKAIYTALYAYISDTSLTTLSGVYSTLNQVLRRGGIFKNGAITLHYDYDYPYVSEFLNMTREQVSWAKRALNVDEHLITSHPEILADLIEKMQGGDVWLVKKLYDAKGERIYLQVCLEIAIKHRATCLLMHGNLGACTIEEIPQVMAEGVEILCQLHAITGVGDSGIYRKPEEDRQVGYGLLGLANLLAIEGVTYLELVQALSLAFKDGKYPITTKYSQKALDIVDSLIFGYRKGAEIAKKYGMERAFTIAPTATCSYNHVDREGYTTAPEIAPPINRSIERDSATFGVKSYDYHPKTEIAAEVGWETFFKLNSYFQRLMDSTGLGHSISMNWWSDMIYADQKFIQDFLDSPIKSLYYSLPVKPNTQDKSTFTVPSGEIIDFSIFGFEPQAESSRIHCTSCSE
jgi:hypothetical protein